MSLNKGEFLGSMKGSQGAEQFFCMANARAAYVNHQKKQRKKTKKNKRHSSITHANDPWQALLKRRKSHLKAVQEAQEGDPRLSCEQLHERRQLKALIDTIKPSRDTKRKREILPQIKQTTTHKLNIKTRLDMLANKRKQLRLQQQAKKEQIKLKQRQKRQSRAKRAAAQQEQRRKVKAKTGLTTWLYDKPVHILLRETYLKIGHKLPATQGSLPSMPRMPRHQSAECWRKWKAFPKNKTRLRQSSMLSWAKRKTPLVGEIIPPRLLPPRKFKKPKNKQRQYASVFTNINYKQTLKIAYKIKIATLNCPGIVAISATGRRKRKTIRQYCKNHRIDILALQETHATEELSKLSSFFPFKTYSSTTSSSVGGVAFIIFNPKIKVLNSRDAGDGMMYSITIEYKERTITVVNFYVPPYLHKQQELLHKHMAVWDNTKPTLFVGDWNFVDDPAEDTIGRKGDVPQPPLAFEYMREYYQLIDIMAIKPAQHRMTRWNPEFTSGSRLDRIYASGNMARWIMDTRNQAIPCSLPTSIRDTISDHNIVSVSISATDIPRGKGYWKLNTQILKNIELQNKILTIMEDFILQQKNKRTLFTQYKQMKAKIRMTLRDWSTQRGKAILKQIIELKQDINLSIKIIEDESKKDQWKQTSLKLLKARRRMAQISLEISEGAWVRSRAKWDFEADKCSRMYFNLEKQHSRKKAIEQIKTKQGHLTSDPTEISEVFRDFYQELYSNRPTDEASLQKLLEKLELNTKKMKNKKITNLVSRAEIRKAIKGTKRGSSPGPDGLPIAFYKTFPRTWGIILTEVYKEIARTGKIPVTMSESFITLLPKGTSDPLIPANWRPISLLNSDYKILTKVWTSRLNPVMQEGIGPHQTGFIPGRDIRENIILTQTIIDRLVKQKSEGGILLLDLAKAYDRISHKSIWEVAKKLDFPEHGLQFLKAIYRNPVSWILVNGFLSRKIKVRSGVRQGCPLSPQIFTLVAELLNQNLIKNVKFEGFQVNQQNKVKVIAYADDIGTPLLTIRAATKFLKILKLYESATASKVNITKTCFISCKNDGRVAQYLQGFGYTIKQPGSLTKYLGIPIGVKPNYDKVWHSLKLKISIELRRWHKICTTIYGRTIILKSKGLGKLWYMASLLPINAYASGIIKEIQKECTNFFWSYKGHKLRYANLMLPKREGGFELWDLKAKIISLQIKWIIKLEDPKNHALWKLNVAEILNRAQQLNAKPIPVSHSTKDTSHIHSPIVANFLAHWNKVIDRSPLALVKDQWVASLSQDERPHWVYKIRETVQWKKDKKGNILKNQVVPQIKLSWYQNNDTLQQPTEWSEKAHTLVPITIKKRKGKIIAAMATFPPIAFLKGKKEENIQLITKMTNKDLYTAVVNRTPPLRKKKYKWPQIPQKRWAKAQTLNYKGNEGASIKQTRWCVLNHCLPVNSRLHKMNKDIASQCRGCSLKETIRHCLFTCTKVVPIWNWFQNTWNSITKDTLPPMQSMGWVCNDIKSEFPEQLREISNIISHRIWLNRNKRTFNNKECLNVQAMIMDISKLWNNHIRAQMYMQKLKQEKAILYGQSYRPEVGWKILWVRINMWPDNSKPWLALRATIGDALVQTTLHNSVNEYESKTQTLKHYQPLIRNLNRALNLEALRGRKLNEKYTQHRDQNILSPQG